MESRDYHMFKFLKENRDIKPLTVKKIEESIKEFGVIPGRPVLVDEDFNIIDGQHRFYALKNLDMPITYEIIKDNVMAKTMALNASQSQWQLIDYIKSYSEQNVDCYRKLLKFEEKYKFGISASISVFSDQKLGPADIRKGNVFEINPKAEQIAGYVITLNQVSFYKTKDFIRAITYLFRKASPNQLRDLQVNIIKTKRCANITDYLTCFENIINFRKSKANYIKL